MPDKPTGEEDGITELRHQFELLKQELCLRLDNVQQRAEDGQKRLEGELGDVRGRAVQATTDAARVNGAFGSIRFALRTVNGTALLLIATVVTAVGYFGFKTYSDIYVYARGQVEALAEPAVNAAIANSKLTEAEMNAQKLHDMATEGRKQADMITGTLDAVKKSAKAGFDNRLKELEQGTLKPIAWGIYDPPSDPKAVKVKLREGFNVDDEADLSAYPDRTAVTVTLKSADPDAQYAVLANVAQPNTVPRYDSRSQWGRVEGRERTSSRQDVRLDPKPGIRRRVEKRG